MSRSRFWLWLIFALALGTRLILAFTIPHFTYESYFHLRQVEHITNTGLPLYHDPLSYGGRELVFLPLFYYLLSFFSLLLPLSLVAKIIPNLLLASLTLIVYLVSKKITEHEPGSLLAALIAGFLPILFAPNAITPLSLFLPLVFLNIYAFLGLEEKKHLFLYIGTFVLLCLTSPATFLLVFGQGLYLLLSYLDHKKVHSGEWEIIIFSLFFFLWSQFLFFKNRFITEGISLLWRNVPPQIISQYFPQISILKALVLVSMIPFVAGVYLVYRSLFQVKSKKTFFLISLVVSTTSLAWIKLIEFTLSLAFFGIILAVLFSLFVQGSVHYIQRTKVAQYGRTYLSAIVVLISLTTIYPALLNGFHQNTPSKEEVNAFLWLKDHSPSNAGILGLLEEGHMITDISQRRNVMDDHFGLIKNIEKRFGDLEVLYSTSFQTEALSLLDEYEINYLVLTPRAQEKYGLKKFKYTTPDCFRKIYDQGNTKIYQVTCSLRRILI